MNEKLDWKWLPQWTPTFAVLVGLLAAVVPASFHLGGEMARLDHGQTELKAGLARVETRVDTLATRMDSLVTRMETRMDAFETRMDAFETRIESLLGRMHQDVREDSTEVANLRERVAALEAAS